LDDVSVVDIHLEVDGIVDGMITLGLGVGVVNLPSGFALLLHLLLKYPP
jgi:hypothetical protein